MCASEMLNAPTYYSTLAPAPMTFYQTLTFTTSTSPESS